MTFQEAINAAANNGPGKFECEPAETFYFYDAYMNGGGEYIGDDCQAFEPTAEEREAFNLTDGALLCLWFSENGFVSSNEYIGCVEELENEYNAN